MAEPEVSNREVIAQINSAVDAVRDLSARMDEPKGVTWERVAIVGGALISALAAILLAMLAWQGNNALERIEEGEKRDAAIEREMHVRTQVIQDFREMQRVKIPTIESKVRDIEEGQRDLRRGQKYIIDVLRESAPPAALRRAGPPPDLETGE